MTQISQHPCPICQEMVCIVGSTAKGEKLVSCGHKFKFKKTRSQKDMDKKYVRMPWGLELVKE